MGSFDLMWKQDFPFNVFNSTGLLSDFLNWSLTYRHVVKANVISSEHKGREEYFCS
jgi:hypothetical protein